MTVTSDERFARWQGWSVRRVLLHAVPYAAGIAVVLLLLDHFVLRPQSTWGDSAWRGAGVFVLAYVIQALRFLWTLREARRGRRTFVTGKDA